MMTPRPSLARNERGQVLMLVAVGLVTLTGMIAFVTDVGYVLVARRALQASTDAAAAAGAMDIGEEGGDPVGKATAYGSVSGGKNVRSILPNVSMTAAVKCTNFMAQLMTGANCTSATTPQNTMVVTQTSVVPMYFAKVLGINTMRITATATAAMRGGTMPPLDIIIVLDTTNSMEGTPLSQAKAGIRTLLGTLWPCQSGVDPCGTNPPIDKVGLYIFPGVRNSTSVGYEYDCRSSPDPVTVNYSASPVYEIIPMTNDYRTSTAAGLNSSSNFVKAVEGPGCGSGLEAIGGFGSYFASAISAAQSKLMSAGRTNIQNVIIFISDGDANEYSGGPTNPCQQAINAAAAAKAAGTWVYSIGYGVDSGGCNDDPPGHPTALQTMQRINSDYPALTKFFNVPSSGSLVATFQKIGTSLLNTRLIDDSTP
jgi:Mg-chelatase subunit ChlD